MKKILFVVLGLLLFASCSSSKRFDAAAEDRGVKPLSQQVVEAIKADADFQNLTYKYHKDEIVWVSQKKGRKGWQIQAYNPDPILSPFGRFVRLRWLKKDVSFIGGFKSVKLSDEEQEDILEALKPLFDSVQKSYIEKTNKKYHQVEGQRGLLSCGESICDDDMPELHISFFGNPGEDFFIVFIKIYKNADFMIDSIIHHCLVLLQ